jgi:hypothetical protein
LLSAALRGRRCSLYLAPSPPLRGLQRYDGEAMGANKCMACGIEVVGGATKCPACGAKLRKTVSPLPIMIGGLILAAVIMALFGR